MQEITDYKQFLDEVKASLIEVTEMGAKEEKLNKEYVECKINLEAGKKALDDKIKITIDSRRSEINKTYNDELSVLEDKIKKAKSKREKAKNKGIKDRIKDETKELVEENKSLKQDIKKELKAGSLPGFCSFRLFLSLYFPHRFTDFIVMIAVFAVCFALIPCFAFYLLKQPENPIIRIILIYIISILFFGFIYIFIGNITKAKKRDILQKVVSISDIRINNKKRISLIIKEIRRDKNEDIYNLNEFDDEISNLNNQIEELNAKKQDAISNFENVTKNILIDELTLTASDEISALEEQEKTLKEEIEGLELAKKDKNLYISDNYESYLGRDFLNIEKIEALQAFMEENSFSSISEAIEKYKTANS